MNVARQYRTVPARRAFTVRYALRRRRQKQCCFLNHRSTKLMRSSAARCGEESLSPDLRSTSLTPKVGPLNAGFSLDIIGHSLTSSRSSYQRRPSIGYVAHILMTNTGRSGSQLDECCLGTVTGASTVYAGLTATMRRTSLRLLVVRPSYRLICRYGRSGRCALVHTTVR